MKPCKLNFQSKIFCQISYTMANFDSNHIHVLQRSKICMFRKGCLNVRWQEVVVFFSESVFHSICWKPLSIDYLRLNHQEILPNHSTWKLLECGNLYVFYCIVCHSIQVTLYTKYMNWPYMQIFNNMKNTFFHHFSVHLMNMHINPWIWCKTLVGIHVTI